MSTAGVPPRVTRSVGPGVPQWDDQLPLAALGRPLSEITFTVVDLETTGGSAAKGAMITEIGAVQVRGGEVLGEFQTLVDPGGPIPPFIVSLTGIDDVMVHGAPRIDSVLPAFLEFAAGTVLVAHNAPFDVGFLKYFAEQQGREWPGFEVVDTVTVARRVVPRDEAPNVKLETLAKLFSASTQPVHRALDDARATVDVLHALIGRLGSQGVQTLEELRTWSGQVTDAQRRKRGLADGLPTGPGVYVFEDPDGRPLYVGTSRTVRKRVQTYFTASESRGRIRDMVALAERVTAVECATPLEAAVRELRLIAAHKPRYNRRSRHPEKTVYVKLTDEPWPRLSVVRRTKDDDVVLGAFPRRGAADAFVETLHETFTIRQCGGRMPQRGTGSSCALADLGRCSAPCIGSTTAEQYLSTLTSLRASVHGDPTPVLSALSARMATRADQERFEEAAALRDRAVRFARATARHQRLRAFTAVPHLVASRREDDGHWSVHVIAHGRLTAAGVIPARANAWEFVRVLTASAETVVPGAGPLPAATAEESELVLRWLEQDGVRLVECEGEWISPLPGAGAHLAAWEPAAQAPLAAHVPSEQGLGGGRRRR